MALVRGNAFGEDHHRMRDLYPPQHAVPALHKDPSRSQGLVRRCVHHFSPECAIDGRSLKAGQQERKYQKRNPAPLHPY
ncbi:MAG TPA: hypothetical protein VFR84_18415 [Candidatus Angelobacter sp.]|nr:hypothetical protein [Candidatus Angelobacter sp.]